jgi:uncharacterized membrane protein YfcA
MNGERKHRCGYTQPTRVRFALDVRDTSHQEEHADGSPGDAHKRWLELSILKPANDDLLYRAEAERYRRDTAEDCDKHEHLHGVDGLRAGRKRAPRRPKPQFQRFRMLFGIFIAAVAVVAGGIAAVTGFGVGSLLTPALAIETGTKLAVAAIAIPHVVATGQRFWTLRRHVDRRILLGFGIASAVGGLGGALLGARISSDTLSVVFGVLLLLAGLSEFTGWMQRVRWGRRSAWVAGALSGILGGLVGNQGGIRTAAMLGFDVPKQSFVATASAIALFVDGARIPVYLATQGGEIAALWPLVLLATMGVVIGTALGTRVLGRVPQRRFRRVIAGLLVALGLYMSVAAAL